MSNEPVSAGKILAFIMGELADSKAKLESKMPRGFKASGATVARYTLRVSHHRLEILLAALADTLPEREP
jgi:hypothetical protein